LSGFGLKNESVQCPNLALTVFYVPNSLDISIAEQPGWHIGSFQQNGDEIAKKLMQTLT
jgi:hypothetical protein